MRARTQNGLGTLKVGSNPVSMRTQGLPVHLRFMIRDYYLQKFRDNKIFDEVHSFEVFECT